MAKGELVETAFKYDMTEAEKSWLEHTLTKDEAEIERFPALLWVQAFEKGRRLGRTEGFGMTPEEYAFFSKEPAKRTTFEEWQKSQPTDRKPRGHAKRDLPASAS